MNAHGSVWSALRRCGAGIVWAAAMTAASAGGVAPSASAVCPLPIGATVPQAEVRTPDGQAVSLKEAVDGRPTVLIFYRGGW